MKRVISFLFGLTAFAALSIPLTAHANLVIGQAAFGPTLYCLSKEDAEEFAKAVVAKDEAKVLEKQAPGVCHFHPSNFTPKKLLSTHGTEDPVYVVEVESGGGTFYLVTMVKVSSGPPFRGTSI